MPGMSVNVHLDFSKLIKNSSASLVVPIEAVFSPEDTKLSTKTYMVWTVDMQSKKTQVTIGQINNFGLKSGDSVVSTGVNFIKEG